jgi:hypothetical protein
MGARFKNELMNNAYKTFRRLGASGTFHKAEAMYGTAHEAYINGHKGIAENRYPRNSLSYAAWAAGRDDARLKKETI